MNYVYSTISTNMFYALYAKNDNQEIAVIEKQILIKGGANVADKHFVTPKGVVTEVDDKDLALLLAHPVFKQQMEAGFLSIEKKEVKVEKVVSNMKAKDESAPKVEADFKNKKGPKVHDSSLGAVSDN